MYSIIYIYMSISACNFPIKQGGSVPWRGECPVADAISKRQTRAKHVKSVDGWWHIPPRLSIPKALGRLNGFLEILRFGFFLAHPKIGWRWLLKMTTGHWLSIIVWPIMWKMTYLLTPDVLLMCSCCHLGHWQQNFLMVQSIFFCGVPWVRRLSTGVHGCS